MSDEINQIPNPDDELESQPELAPPAHVDEAYFRSLPNAAEAAILSGEAEVESLASKVESEIETWFRDTFHNLGPELSADLHNRFFAAKQALKARLGPLF